MKSKRAKILAGALTLLLVAASAGGFFYFSEPEEESLANFIRENPSLNRHSQAIAVLREKFEQKNGGEGPREITAGPAQEQYDNRAYPETYISYERSKGADDAEQEVERRGNGRQSRWQEIGPITPVVPGPSNYTGRTTTNSGRVTALLVDPRCHASDCKLWLGAAGGGVWFTPNALAPKPNWQFISQRLSTNAIGSLAFDPQGQALYVGTGEPNGSSDSEAGLGLYRTEDNGRSWDLLPGSFVVAKDRSIAAIAIDPTNADHIFIGTAVARHGSSSVNGGRFTPPGAAPVGLYESKDGGQTFKLVFSKASDVVNPGSANGSDFFRGGISKIEYAPNGQIYFSIFDYGLFRSSGSGFEQVFASAGGGTVANSLASRTEFALAPRPGGKLRIYVGDVGGGAADFFRVDDANVPATQLTNGTSNPGWTKLSNSTPGTPGYGSYNYCGGQCSYDMPVASPAGRPDVVWIGGQMQYDEIFTRTPSSNGRTVQRSTDKGVSFTDMTNDTQSPPLGMHPDQHAIAFDPENPDIAFLGSDGGLVRTSGQFADASADCANRGISGAELIDCQSWLKAIPTQIFSMNDGLATLQFQSLSINAQDPGNDILGGTQDNGTWAYSGKGSGSWFESVGGDGGQSGTDIGSSNIRMHSYFSAQHDVNFRGTDPLGWNWISDPLLGSGEAASFYVPLINDPKVSSTWFVGLQHVWRTKDNGGDQAYLEQHCNEFTGDFSDTCGDWEPIGQDLSGTAFGSDKGGTGPTGNYVVATERTASDASTLWAATRRGRVFISKNADAAAGSVSFTRIDTPAQPTRFVSGIAIDPSNPNHAWISYSGYDAYARAAGTATGHVFEVTYDPNTGAAAWKDLSLNLGDQPITDIARDDKTGDLYVSTDWGVSMLPARGKIWVNAATGLPRAAVYGLTISSNARILYAATHGRGAFRLDLSK